MKISIIANPRKKKVYSILRTLIPWLKRRGVKVFISRDIASRQAVANKGNILIALGGDGTLLEAVRLLKGRDIPILGVNAGGLGFLTEVTLEELYPLLENVLKGKFEIDVRAMLEVTLAGVPRKKPKVLRGKQKKFFALNDAVITRGAFSRILRLKVYIEGELANVYLSDGLILATPTGSTAHSLSAGGPIVHPELKVITISPICPHTMTNRPLIIPGDKEVVIELDTSAKFSINPEQVEWVDKEKVEVALTADGQVWKSLTPGQKIKVKMAKDVVRLITNPEKSYFEVLRKKLHWKGMTV